MDRAMTDKRRKDRQTMILFFTGTGNSRYVAGLISELTGDTELRDMGAMITGRLLFRKAFCICGADIRVEIAARSQ